MDEALQLIDAALALSQRVHGEEWSTTLFLTDALVRAGHGDAQFGLRLMCISD